MPGETTKLGGAPCPRARQQVLTLIPQEWRASEKIGCHPHPRTSECYLTWKRSLCRSNSTEDLEVGELTTWRHVMGL